MLLMHCFESLLTLLLVGFLEEDQNIISILCKYIFFGIKQMECV